MYPVFVLKNLQFSHSHGTAAESSLCSVAYVLHKERESDLMRKKMMKSSCAFTRICAVNHMVILNSHKATSYSPMLQSHDNVLHFSQVTSTDKLKRVDLL